jgi:hypothetical protein
MSFAVGLSVRALSLLSRPISSNSHSYGFPIGVLWGLYSVHDNDDIAVVAAVAADVVATLSGDDDDDDQHTNGEIMAYCRNTSLYMNVSVSMSMYVSTSMSMYVSMYMYVSLWDSYGLPMGLL